MQEVDLTPDPRVLIALTHTPLQPLDALCELIDNAFDSFESARLGGGAIQHPLIDVRLPGTAEVERGEGAVVIRDNGPGLSVEDAEKALRAGFSSHNPYDSLGLFGLGFNIASGKLGRVTRFLTARENDDHAVEIVVDLLKMQEAASFKVPVTRVPKPDGLRHGTVIEVGSWWSEGNPNFGFIKKTAGLPKKTVREQLGRRYATVLRDRGVRLHLNTEPCEAFEHCVWDDSRFVEHPKHGKIHAVIRFDKVIGQQTRCGECNALLGATAQCAACGSRHLRTIKERVYGWVGIQRFEDEDLYGIDLIRNGRAIRVSEKAAFFEFRDEYARVTRDYPIDSPYGRIVGEVHIDHVPVDFLKQDFQRTTPEWQHVATFLRGESSLQPTKPNADQNGSPIFMLYQGYRRVRNFGRRDMYMGYWDADAGKAKRLSKQEVDVYYQKFLERIPGFYDDSEWWKQVEAADQKPVDELLECPNPNCRAQNLKTADKCLVCGHVIAGKTCLNPECAATIAVSEIQCPVCGADQIPQVYESWECAVCGRKNAPEEDTCPLCGRTRGSKGLGSQEFLRENADLDDELSWRGCSIELPDGTHSQQFDVRTFVCRGPLQVQWGGPFLPLVVFKTSDLEVFVDKTHPVFRAYRVRPEVYVAEEIAQYIYDTNRHLLVSHSSSQNLATLCWRILEARWSSALEDSPDRVRSDIRALFDLIRRRLVHLAVGQSDSIFDGLTELQQQRMVNNMLGSGVDIGNLGALKQSGEFILHIDEATLVDLFRKHPDYFFDGGIWAEPYGDIVGLPEIVIADARATIFRKYFNCLDDCAGFVGLDTPESLITHRARMSLDFLSQRLT